MSTAILPVTAYNLEQPIRRRPAATLWGTSYLAFTLLSFVVGVAFGFPATIAMLVFASFMAAIVGLRWRTLGLLGIGVLCTLDAPARMLLGDSAVGAFWRWNSFNYLLVAIFLPFAPSLLRLRDPHSRLLWLFIALVGAQLVLSGEWTDGTQHVLGILSVFGLLIYVYRSAQDDHAWLWLGIVCSAVAALAGLFFYMRKASIGEMNENSWAYVPLTALLTAVLAWFAGPRQSRLKPLLVLLTAVNVVWVVLSGSRGTMGDALFCVLFLLVFVQGVFRRAVYLALGIALASAVVMRFAQQEQYAITRVDKVFDDSRTLANKTSGRSELALAGWYIFQEHPFGVGTGKFASARVEMQYRHGLLAFQGREMQAHSGWIKTLAENGAPGFLLLMAYVFSFTVVGWLKRHQRRFAIGLFTTIIISAALVSAEFQAKGLWLLAAAATVLLHRPDESRTPEVRA